MVCGLLFIVDGLLFIVYGLWMSVYGVLLMVDGGVCVWRFGVEIFFEISVFEIENNLFYNLTIGVGTCV